MIVNMRADCCSARAGYRIILPATSARRESAELLLCGHHRQTSRAALDAQGALVVELDHGLATV